MDRFSGPFFYKLIIVHSFLGVIVLSEITQIIDINSTVQKGELRLNFSYNGQNIFFNLSEGNCLFDLHIPILTWKNKKIVKIRNAFERKVAYCSEERNASFLIHKSQNTDSHNKALYGTFYVETDKIVEVKPCYRCQHTGKLKSADNLHIFTESTIDKETFDSDIDKTQIFLQENNEQNHLNKVTNRISNQIDESDRGPFLSQHGPNKRNENFKSQISTKNLNSQTPTGDLRSLQSAISSDLSQQFPGHDITNESSVLHNTRSQQIYDTSQSDWSPYGLPLPKPRTRGGKLHYIVQML